MAAHQAPLSLGFSRQEHWSRLPYPTPMHECMLNRFSHVRLCATPWTAAQHGPLATGFSRQEDCSGMPFPSPKNTSTEKRIELLTSSLCDNVKSSNKKKRYSKYIYSHEYNHLLTYFSK